jgi:hypothetical protein
MEGIPARLGLAAGVGEDLPLQCLEWLHTNAIDLSGLQVCSGSMTPRAWQILEADGTRHEVRCAAGVSWSPHNSGSCLLLGPQSRPHLSACGMLAI